MWAEFQLSLALSDVFVQITYIIYYITVAALLLISQNSKF